MKEFHSMESSEVVHSTYLVFCQQGQVEENFDGLCIGSHHHNLADATVEGLGCCDGELEYIG